MRRLFTRYSRIRGSEVLEEAGGSRQFIRQGEQLVDRRAFLSTLPSLAVGWLAAGGTISEGGQLTDEVPNKRFEWTLGPPLIMPANRPEDPCHAIKDPSIVYYQGHWHLFCTIRSQKRSHQIEYLSFTDFKDANNAQRHVLKLTDGYFAAPQVFYFSPHAKWYLICQIIDSARKARASTGLFDDGGHYRPGIMDQTRSSILCAARERHNVDRLLGHL